MELRSILDARRVVGGSWVQVEGVSGLEFLLKPYQRGYRWGKNNVKKLLNDINLFFEGADENLLNYTDVQSNQNSNTDVYDFYCLQALAVKKEDTNKYELIDGQQRLTTLFMVYELLNAFTESYDDRADAPYTLLYQRGGANIEDFNLSEEIHNIIPFKVNGTTAKKAYRDGVGRRNFEWFKAYKEELKSQILSIAKSSEQIDSLTIDLYCLSEVAEQIVDYIYEFNDSLNSIDNLRRFYTCIQRIVLFLWYEIPNNVNAVTEFNDLNTNKIDLTNAELIKALVLKNDKSNENYAHRWETIEQGLCQSELWSFISGEEKATRIDLVLELFAQMYEGNPYKPDNSDDEYALFEWYEALHGSNEQAVFTEKVIKGLEEIYGRICEWYDDVDIYHYIGLLTCFRAKLTKYKTQENLITEIFRIYNQSENQSEFIKTLKTEEIKKCILYGVSKENTPSTIEGLEACFSYTEGSQKENLKAILWLLNAWETIEASENNVLFKEKGVNRKIRKDVVVNRLPFSQINGNLKTAKKWTLEHIMPQNPKDESGVSSEDKTAYDNLAEIIKNNGINVVDEDGVHRIGNMALLTQQTNSEIKNGNLGEKRDKIIQLVGEGEYVPISTINVFCLYYNSLDNDHNQNNFDNMYWTVANKESYIKKIAECLIEHEIISGTHDNGEGVNNDE